MPWPVRLFFYGWSRTETRSSSAFCTIHSLSWNRWCPVLIISLASFRRIMLALARYVSIIGSFGSMMNAAQPFHNKWL